MTLAELLALVGRAWSRLLLYPGGLSLIAMAWLVFALEQNRFHRKGRKEREGNAKGTNLVSSPFAFLALFAVNTPALLAAPWLAVALLPLPGAVDLGRSIDVVVALALLDVPLFATLWAELRGDAAHERGVRRLAAALNGYPPLLLALLLLAATTGSLELRQLASIPAVPEQAITHWFGVAALVLALPAALGIGAFAPPQSPAPFALALRFRQVGMFLLVLLPLLAPFTGLWQLGPPPLLALALWAFDRATKRHFPRRYALGYVFLVGMIFGALLLLAAWQVQEPRVQKVPTIEGVMSIPSALLPVTRMVTQLHIDYYVGGSIASTAYSLPRSTYAIDLATNLQAWHGTSRRLLLPSKQHITLLGRKYYTYLSDMSNGFFSNKRLKGDHNNACRTNTFAWTAWYKTLYSKPIRTENQEPRTNACYSDCTFTNDLGLLYNQVW